ncbi:helix-turn-helix domain-containing protein [Bacillus sp. 3255]|uniref:helix-turn-helix domain-containing protein n=1 Tax=Bacillus sp. 3255 TaxID=2817904 RepID=UPI00286B128F|nr:helix-turn-helix domain-containing protein [Bacillus sp. 3255]
MNQTNRILDERFNGIEESALRLSLDPQVRRFLNDEVFDSERRFNLVQLMQYLYSVIRSNDFVIDMYVYYEKSGLIVTSTSTTNIETFYQQTLIESGIDYETWLKVLREKHTLDYLPVTTASLTLGKQDVISIMQSVDYKVNGNSFATLVMLVDADKLKALLKDIAVVDQGVVYLLDNRREVLISLGNPSLIRSLNNNEALFSVGSSHVNFNGHEYSIFKANPFSSNRELISIIQTNLIMQSVNESKEKFIIFSSLAVFISLLIAYRGAKSNYRPVKKLITGLEGKVIGIEPQSSLGNEFEYIERVTETILRDRDQSSSILKEQIPIMRSNLLTQLVKGNILSGELEKHSPQSLGLNMPYSWFCFLLVQVDLFHSDSWEEKRYAKFVIGNVIEHLGATIGPSYVVELEPERLGLLINLNNTRENLNRELIDIAERTVEFIRIKFKIHISIGVGRVQSGIEGIHHSYREALHAIDYQTIQGTSAVIHIQDLSMVTEENNYIYTVEMEMSIFKAIRVGDIQKTRMLLNDIFQINPNIGSTSLTMSRCLFFDVMSTAIKVLNQESVHVEHIFGNRNPFDELYACKTIIQMQAVLIDIFTQICSHVQVKLTSRSEGVRSLILKYMNTHYADADLSLSMLADVFKLNPSYLSNVFKEHLGDNFMTMLMKLRVEAAKEKLLNPSLSVQDVAQIVGYTNSNTFIRNFKKIEGITPGEYREMTKRD